MTDAESSPGPDPDDVDVESLDDNGWVRLHAPRFLPPGLPAAARSGMDGVVTDAGTVDVDQYDNLALGVASDAALDPGVDVDVTLRDGHLHARPTAVSEAVRQHTQRRRELAERAEGRARAREQRQRKAEAEAFWSQYDIPVAFTVAIKGRRSGLLEGSCGDGRAANTVEHLVVQEAVDDGRLQRDAESYLCDDSAEFRFTEGVTRSGPGGEAYAPPVTCTTCLERMERWRTADDADTDDGRGCDG